MANGMPWSQRNKMLAAGAKILEWEAVALAAGVHIAQMNIIIEPVEEGDPATDIIFEWNAEAAEYIMRTSGT
jgi:hypothetical protein